MPPLTSITKRKAKPVCIYYGRIKPKGFTIVCYCLRPFDVEELMHWVICTLLLGTFNIISWKSVV